MTEAAELALRALRHRDRSRRDLEERLDRAGVEPEERDRALDELTAAGLLSDERYALERARSLAARSSGNALIRADLRRHGISDDGVEEALAALDPEEVRAATVFERRGGGERALRYLAGKGFSPETVDSLSIR